MSSRCGGRALTGMTESHLCDSSRHDGSFPVSDHNASRVINASDKYLHNKGLVGSFNCII